MESIIETKQQSSCSLSVDFGEACRRAGKKEPTRQGLYVLLQPHVANIAVCDPRTNTLLQAVRVLE